MLANLAILANVTNMARFRQCKLPNLYKLAKHREAHHVGESGDFGECNVYGENFIKLPNLCKLISLTTCSSTLRTVRRMCIFIRAYRVK